MMRIAGVLIAFAVMTLLGALGVEWMREQRATNAVGTYLECHECGDRDVAPVLKLRSRAAEPLLDALVEGPSPQARRNMAVQTAQAFTGAAGIPLDEYVHESLDAYARGYRLRAIRGLVELGQHTDARTAAQAALERAWSMLAAGTEVTIGTSVLRELERGRLLLAGGELYDAVPAPPGTVGFIDTTRYAPVRVEFGDTVTVLQTGSPFGDSTDVHVHGSPFGDRVLVRRWDDSVKYEAIGRSGAYLVSVQSPADTQRHELFITRWNPHAHTAAEAETLYTDLPSRRYLGLRSGSDYWRVLRRGGDTGVTALIAWGDHSVSLRVSWRRCDAPDSLVPSAPSDTGVIRGRALAVGSPLAGASVRIAGQQDSVVTDALGEFVISGLGPGVRDLEIRASGHVPMQLGIQPGLPDPVELHLAPLRLPPPRRLAVEFGTRLPSGCALLAMDLVSAPQDARPVILRLETRGGAPRVSPSLLIP